MAVKDIYEKVDFIKPKDAAKLVVTLLAILAAIVFDACTPDVYPDGYTEFWYPLLLKILFVAYLVFAVLSVWFPKVRAKTVHLWGLLILLMLLVSAYTWETVKTGNLLLPVMPSPDKIIAAVFDHGESVWENFCGSLSLLLQGILLGAVFGMIYGTLMGYSKFFNYWLQPLIKVIGPVPSTAWMAIAMVLAPSSHWASVFLVGLTTWFPLSVNLSGGIRGIPKVYVERAQIMGASRLHIITHVIYPAVLPNIFTGLFMGFCFSMTSLVGAERLGVQSGLGWLIDYAQNWNEFDIIFSTIIIFILMAFVMLTILFTVQKHVMKWSKGAIQW